MRFEPIVHIYIFDIKGNICYNKGVGKSSYSKIVVIITLKYLELNRGKTFDYFGEDEL